MKQDDPAKTGPQAKPAPKRYAKRRKPLSWPLLVGIAVLHVAVLYGLARALVPDIVTSVEREVVAAFDVSETPPPPPPENIPEPDEGAQGDTGETAIAAPVSAPPTTLPLPAPVPLPPAASKGDEADSGAGQSGEGTGAAGSGVGTGSGNQGSGAGGVAVTRPEHISGSINNARDYPTPPGGREARRGTEVIVRVIVGTNGRARNCSVYRASPDAEADRITCQLVVDRLGFRPAQDANGNPVDAPFYWRQRWF
ncbi:MAG: TonB family protein [Pseudomonadota bacterium]